MVPQHGSPVHRNRAEWFCLPVRRHLIILGKVSPHTSARFVLSMLGRAGWSGYSRSCAVSAASTGFQLMTRHVCMASLYLWSSVHTGGPSSKTLTRIDVMYVACCVSLPEILDMTHCRVHAVLCYSRKATFSYVNCLHAMAQSFSIENRLGRPVWSTTH